MTISNNEVVLFSWPISATGDWSKETGIGYLERYATGEMKPEQLVEYLWGPGAYVQNSALQELVEHGCLRQAAVFVRSLLEVHPVCEKTLRYDFGNLVDGFLTVDLNELPSKPSEYPKEIQIRIVSDPNDPVLQNRARKI